ncbi:uncharacterized protein GGS22DRAFT_139460 [Annulohypoxylon maeteangense]|uniref:uncharacterized protein n=1 Tax=Annulohypoxylon maeteangense TaxID=1927788 RepID=UPI002008A58E|nr:uncharacterized protein GGS22DRAFT_139460 [Annulohypoxylon maeteangense]KAI0885139.1 hypothetical protein GGS22DRAFT_139460 [Annulohypoxylon maeteangense]
MAAFGRYEPNYEDDGFSREPKTPGEVVMWFGKFKGTQLEKLDDNYRWKIYRMGREIPSNMLREFRDVHDRYTAWLDETRSPLSTEVWFGQHRGHELRVLYAAPRKWNWLVKNTVWGPELVGIEKRFIAWRARHPKKQPASRARPVILNPVGRRLGPADDRVASDNDESYDSDDGFVVSDNEMDDSDWDEDEWKDDEDSEDVEYFTDGEVSNDETATLQDEEMAEAPSDRDFDSDSSISLPSVAEIARRSAAKKTPTKSSPPLNNRHHPYANSTPIRPRSTRHKYIVTDSDDDEDDDDMPITTPSQSTGKIRKTFDFTADPEITPKANSSRRVTSRRTNQEDSPSRGSKNLQSTVITLSSDSEVEAPSSSLKIRGQKLPVHITDTETADSDDEPLVPKLRKEWVTKARR